MTNQMLEQAADEFLKANDPTSKHRKNLNYSYLNSRQMKKRSKKEMSISNLPKSQKWFCSLVMYSADE